MDASTPILIAYDGSDGSKAAIDAAGRLFPDRRALVVAVWHSVATAAPASLIAIPANVASRAYEELDGESERQAAARAAEGVAAAKAAGLDASGEAMRCAGQVWATIVNAADEADAQAIVVGTRGLSAIKSALVGSVANGVLHHSARPVVVVPTAG